MIFQNCDLGDVSGQPWLENSKLKSAQQRGLANCDSTWMTDFIV